MNWTFLKFLDFYEKIPLEKVEDSQKLFWPTRKIRNIFKNVPEKRKNFKTIIVALAHSNPKSFFVGQPWRPTLFLRPCPPTILVLLRPWYVGKSATPFKIKLNNHRKDVKNLIAIPACKHFNKHDHDFNNHGKFIIIATMKHTCYINWDIKRKTKTARKLRRRKLETLPPHLPKSRSKRKPRFAAFHSLPLFFL